MSAPFIGVIDIPLNPEIVSLATLGIPANICLESISIPSNGISYISELEFTFLLDGEQIWQGRGKSGGIEFGIPEEFAFSEKGRSLLILVSPSLMLSLPSMELSTTELPIAIFAFKSIKTVKSSKIFLDPNLILANAAMKKYKN